MNAYSSGYSMSIVGPTTLKGKELREVLVEKRFPIKKMRLLDAGKGGKLTEFNGEPKLVQQIEDDSFDGVDIAFFCGDPAETAKFLPWAEKKGFTAIDLSQAHLAGKNVPVVVAGVNEGKIIRNRGIIRNPHPITISLCTILHLLKRAFGIQYAVCTIYQPVSEYGEEGMDELFKQTISVLNFKRAEGKIFTKQVAFNLIPRVKKPYAKRYLDYESELINEIKAVMGREFPPLTISMIQAPVFHSHAISMFVALNSEPTSEEVESQLKTSAALCQGPLSPTPVESAGSDIINLGRVRRDKQIDRGYWLWIVTDNLRRGCALNAVRIAELLVSSSKARST